MFIIFTKFKYLFPSFFVSLKLNETLFIISSKDHRQHCFNFLTNSGTLSTNNQTQISKSKIVSIYLAK
ncbi:TPA: hypothetical protein DEG21_06020 [Patescibacteria group bacterium]|nr:hypothetical protein [Candidatus Gracilibacteria bacterium]